MPTILCETNRGHTLICQWSKAVHKYKSDPFFKGDYEDFSHIAKSSKTLEEKQKVHVHEQVSKESKGNGSKTKKEKDKKAYLGKGKLSNEEMERYKKENQCYKCGEQGQISHACPKW